MTEQIKNKLIENLPPNITIYSSMDYPNDGMAKIRGVCRKSGFTITYNYLDNEDICELYLVTLDEEGADVVIPLSELKSYLS